MRNAVLILFGFLLFLSTGQAQDCPHPFTIVVLGSSTSVGNGASSPEKAYVELFRTYLTQSVNAGCEIINLAVGATTTYYIQPASFSPPAPFFVDPEKNIEAAVALAPNAILINLPSNDAALDIPIQVQKDNFTRVASYAHSHNIPLWITSTQPRNLSATRRNILMEMKAWLEDSFGSRCIDFWTEIANTNGTINTAYNSGDGVHLNDAGHAILFDRVKNSTLVPEICYSLRTLEVKNFTAKGNYADAVLHWEKVESEPGRFIVQCSISGFDNWQDIAELDSSPNGQTTPFTYTHKNALATNATLFYRISAVHQNSNVTYSNIQKVQLNAAGLPFTAFGSGEKIIITKIATGTLHYTLFDINGRIIEKNTLLFEQKILNIPVRGIYILRIRDESGGVWTKKIAI